MIPHTSNMNALNNHYFLDTIYHLRNEESILLHTRLAPESEEEAVLLTDFLETEYSNECLEYPGKAPAFDAAAALWGARTLYIASQLLLYRNNKGHELAALFPHYTEVITPAAMLSADLCLRFIPDILVQLKRVDTDDALIPLLESLLLTWHYSGIAYSLPATALSMDIVFSNPCLQQLYINRIIACKARHLAVLPALQPPVMAAMGNFANLFWKDL